MYARSSTRNRHLCDVITWYLDCLIASAAGKDISKHSIPDYFCVLVEVPHARKRARFRIYIHIYIYITEGCERSQLYTRKEI